jgi:hypothetical protein
MRIEEEANLTCDTLCVPVPQPETFLCHAGERHEVPGFHFHCKDSLGEGGKRTCFARTLAKVPLENGFFLPQVNRLVNTFLLKHYPFQTKKQSACKNHLPPHL